MTSEIEFKWRGDISDAELFALTESHGGDSEVGWWDRVRPFSLGWVSARLANGEVAGFVNVAWDGGVHAFLLDTKVRADLQRRGIGTALVRVAAQRAEQAGCQWLHVDFVDHLRNFYFEACGFMPTNAGLIALRS
jgi:GNAT superfamily N-acetyltransferase